MLAIFFIFAESPGTARDCDARRLLPQINATYKVLREGRQLSDSTEALGRIHQRWRSFCKQGRYLAPPSVVIGLGRLTKFPIARYTIASALIDVGPNLKYSRSYLNAAIKDQRRIEDRNRQMASPLLPPTYNIAYDGLRCVMKKITAGVHDSNLCQGVDSLNRESDDMLRSVNPDAR
jgi:hypothetical protein